VAAEDTELRTLVLAQALQGRMTRAADLLYEAALQAAQTCDAHVSHHPKAPDVDEWQARAKYWRSTAQRALDVVTDWEVRTPPRH